MSTAFSGLLFFFFFQAEDGIRDHCVTGVQTCALPILVFGIKRNVIKTRSSNTVLGEGSVGCRRLSHLLGRGSLRRGQRCLDGTFLRGRRGCRGGGSLRRLASQFAELRLELAHLFAPFVDLFLQFFHLLIGIRLSHGLRRKGGSGKQSYR